MYKKVLIVVDMLKDFCQEGGALYFPQSEGVKDYIKKRIDAYHEAGEPVIFLCDAHNKNDKEFALFPPHAIKDTEGAELIEGLVPREDTDIVIEKTRYSGFFNTPLEFYLETIAPQLVEVVGVCTSICVMDTVGGLANRDYTMVVDVPGVADFDDEAHEAALKRMENLYKAELAYD